MKNIKTFNQFINENNINESVSAVVISTKELSTLFQGDKSKEDDEDEIEDIIERLGKIEEIGADSVDKVEITCQHGHIVIDLKHKTVEIGK